MTVTSLTTIKQFAADSSTRLFSVDYKIFAKGDVTVFADVLADGNEIELTLDSIEGYNVINIDPVAETFDISVISTLAPQSSTTVTVERTTPLPQAIDYISNDSFPSATHEEGLDRATMHDQEVRNLAVTKDPTTPLSASVRLPKPEASKTLAWSSTAPFTIVNATLTSTPLTGLVDNATQAVLELDTNEDAVLQVSGSQFTGNVVGSGALLNVVAGTTVPTHVVNNTDPDTGLGGAAPDIASLIAGGVEGIRITEANSHIIFEHETHTGLTASTTQTQGQAPLFSSINNVTTVANANDTVTAPSAGAGRHLYIFSNGANTLQVFPAVGDDLGAGVDTAVTLAAGVDAFWIAFDATTWNRVV